MLRSSLDLALDGRDARTTVTRTSAPIITRTAPAPAPIRPAPAPVIVKTAPVTAITSNTEFAWANRRAYPNAADAIAAFIRGTGRQPDSRERDILIGVTPAPLVPVNNLITTRAASFAPTGGAMPLIPAIGAIAKAAGIGKAIGKVAGKVGAFIGKTVSKGRAVVNKYPVTSGAIVTGAATAVGTKIARPTAQQLPAPQQGGSAGGFDMSFGGIPLITGVFEDVCYKAPRGYSIVTDPMTGEKVAMLTAAARALGLVKRRARGGISGTDIRRARKVQNLITSLTVNRQPRVKIRRKR